MPSPIILEFLITCVIFFCGSYQVLQSLVSMGTSLWETDEACVKETPAGYAGLCPTHYKECLVSLTSAQSLDPATLYEVEELEMPVECYLHVRLQLLAGEDAPAYHSRLLQKLMEEVPLGQSIPCRRN